jgi:hypothetical protein
MCISGVTSATGPCRLLAGHFRSLKQNSERLRLRLLGLMGDFPCTTLRRGIDGARSLFGPGCELRTAVLLQLFPILTDAFRHEGHPVRQSGNLIVLTFNDTLLLLVLEFQVLVSILE